MTLPEEITARLVVLVGRPLTNVSRAADMESLSFGDCWPMTVTQGRRARQTRVISEYALHVMCAWRFRTSTDTLVASQDLYEIVDGCDDLDQIGSNRRDVRMSELVRPLLPTVVRTVRVAPAGGLFLGFERDLVFEVFPDVSGDYEQWRFFQPFQSTPHFALEANKLKVE